MDGDKPSNACLSIFGNKPGWWLLENAVRIGDLIDAVAEGDRQAFHLLYRETHRRVFGAVQRIVRKQIDAVAATEEAYLRIWREAATCEPKLLPPVTWIMTVARATAFEFARMGDYYNPSASRWPMEDEFGFSAEDGEFSLELERLLAVLGRLSANTRRMTLLVYYDGWSCRELSDAFKAQPETVRTWILRSLERIRENTA